MPLQVLNGPIIAAGESLSDSVDCSGGELVRLTMPAQWTPANLSFQVSSDGQGFNDLYRFEHGQTLELVVPVAPGAGILLDFGHKGIAFLKFRSGTSAHPIAQAAQRDFSVALMVP